MSKTLSNGTMALRFMQNAQRAKEQAQVELEQARIKDEAEWEVSQETKDAWGIASTSPGSVLSAAAAVHEASYIPFLFATNPVESSSSVSGPAQPKGRRKFTANGKEEIKKTDESKPTPEPQIEQEAPRRLTSISGFRVPLSNEMKSSGKGKSKSVQELIRENVKKRPFVPTDSAQSSPAGTRFVKPAGVDGPSVMRTEPAKFHEANSLKRERELPSGDSPSAEMKKKRRKKKEVQLIE
ncbi:hypothetical protein BDW22DRAFT_1432026 [Trametopsis cervina]|nr:hypothetical protein BDW22DRAFT_1432026 [Trametopsis cervina]